MQTASVNLRHPSGWALCVLMWLCMCATARRLLAPLTLARHGATADGPPRAATLVPRGGSHPRRCALKMLTSILLLGFATERAKSARAEESPRGAHPIHGGGPTDFLHGVDRYTLVGKRIA